MFSGCVGPKETVRPARTPEYKGLNRVEFAVQAGAFSHIENAEQFTEVLKKKGIQAYYFKSESGFYRVRFGDFPSSDAARSKAEKLKSAGLIDDYCIVSPKEHAVSKAKQFGGEYLRKEIMKTARNFIDVPYRWGGTSAEEGFDCSGFTMAVYDFNGLKLPRSSKEQFKTGIPVKKNELLEGDLVFFATSGGRTVSHVGIYSGNNEFIHAPRKGKRIRTDSLSDEYYNKHYMGARRYL